MSSLSKRIIPSLGEQIERGMIRRIFFAHDVHVIRAGPLPLVRQLLSPDDVGVQYALWGPVSPFSEVTAARPFPISRWKTNNCYSEILIIFEHHFEENLIETDTKLSFALCL